MYCSWMGPSNPFHLACKMNHPGEEENQEDLQIPFYKGMKRNPQDLAEKERTRCSKGCPKFLVPKHPALVRQFEIIHKTNINWINNASRRQGIQDRLTPRILGWYKRGLCFRIKVGRIPVRKDRGLPLRRKTLFLQSQMILG